MAEMRVMRCIDASRRMAGEFAGFLWRRKLWWVIPLATVLLAFGVVIVAGGSTDAGPFVYTLF